MSYKTHTKKKSVYGNLKIYPLPNPLACTISDLSSAEI